MEKHSKIIRPRQLMFMLGVSRSTIWRWEQQGLLPPKITLSERVVGWRAADIESWLRAQTLTSTADSPEAGRLKENRYG